MSLPKSEDRTAELDAALRKFRECLPPEFLEALQPSAPPTIYTPWATVWLLVYQRLHSNATLAKAVTAFLDTAQYFSTNKRVIERTLSVNTGSYSQARQRLKLEVANTVSDHVLTSLLPDSPTSWLGSESSVLAGRRLFVLDGSTVPLDAVPALHQEWPGITNQYGRSAWPMMQVAVAHDLETGMALRPETGAMYGDQAVSEMELAIRLFPRIPRKSVLLADSAFGIFGFVHASVQAGYDTITRLTQPRFRSMVKKARVVSPGVWELKWKPSKKDRKTWPVPEAASVKVYLHEFVGLDGKPIWVATTVKGMTSAEMSAIYWRRSEVEVDIRQWKHQLGVACLRGRSVAMVLKEIAMASVAYNLVVRVRYVASVQGKISPKRLSFSAVWNLVHVLLLEGLFLDRSGQDWVSMMDRVVSACLQRKLPNRPGRSYPRVAYSKRTPKYPPRPRKSDAKTPK
jgi:hypothetical protein